MTIQEVCIQYEKETDPIKKEQLEKAIIKYCNENQDAPVPSIASMIYIAYLCGSKGV